MGKINKKHFLILIISILILTGLISTISLTGNATFWEKRRQAKIEVGLFGATGCQENSQCETNYCETLPKDYKTDYKTITMCNCPISEKWNGTDCYFDEKKYYPEETKNIYAIIWIESFFYGTGDMYLKILDDTFEIIKDRIKVSGSANGNLTETKICKNKIIMVTWQEGSQEYNKRQYIEFFDTEGASLKKIKISENPENFISLNCI